MKVLYIFVEHLRRMNSQHGFRQAVYLVYIKLEQEDMLGWKAPSLVICSLKGGFDRREFLCLYKNRF